MATGRGKTTFTPIRIKQEPMDTNGIDSNALCTARLSSLKLPRDLTLGGTGPLRTQRGNTNKKVYTPNLNVTRNKNTNVKTSKDTTLRGKNRTERGKSDRGGRGRGNRGGLIQTAGLFSEGAGALLLKRASSGSYRSSGGDGEDSGGMRRPTLIKREGKIDTTADNQHIRDILGDSDEDDFKDEKTDLEFVPIKLNEGADEVVTDNFNHLRVKQETNATVRYPSTIEEFFTRTQPQTFLMQLPDSLPCQGTDESNEPSSSKEKDDDQIPINNTSSLHNLEEGQIGKIVRYRSGKLKLILGETCFDLGLAMESGFLQELMSINTNREERSGNMINLGPLHAKLTATPDWEFLFKNYS